MHCCSLVQLTCAGLLCPCCSVAAFFQLTGEEWRSLFSEIRTREFKYVKPDKRLLLDVAQVTQAAFGAAGVAKHSLCWLAQ